MIWDFIEAKMDWILLYGIVIILLYAVLELSSSHD